MKVRIISSSNSFSTHIASALDGIDFSFSNDLDHYLKYSNIATSNIVLLHASTDLVTHQLISSLREHQSNIRIGIASDKPSIDELLSLGRDAIDAYFNSYMASIHYRHMLSTITHGYPWYAPQLLPEMLSLAKRAHTREPGTISHRPHHASLTAREEQISRAIADGLSNKLIADKLSITERTVKAHLSKIYEKLEVKDRLELARYILTSK